ncbi:MAG: DUF1146 domain-containing protein [Erysipelothrix sp.]|nr:DUF1146 domain-containing protein [Erysipelothrix sp.]
MSNLLRITVHITSLMFCAYVLQGVEFSKFLRKGHKEKDTLLYLIVTLALANLVAQFLLNLSTSFI